MSNKTLAFFPCTHTYSVDAPTITAADAPIAAGNNTASNNAPAASSSSESASELYLWTKAWYPIATLDGLRTDKANALQLLGRRLVAWQATPEGEWAVQDEACPHRLAPLSEGRLVKDAASGETQ